MHDRNTDPLAVSIPPGHMWRGQLPHALLLAALLPGVRMIASPVLDGQRWLGVDERVWLLAGVLVPIVPDGVVLYGRSPDGG